ncbi:MAG: hypothetical protein ABIF82_06385 [Planctomycetota bacterium]
MADLRDRCALVTVVALAFACGCAATEPATRVKGKHVDLRVDLAPAEARQLAAEADRFLASVSAYLRAREPTPRVYVFKNGWNLWLYLRRQCPAFAGRTGACFEADDGTLIVALKAGPNGRPAAASLRHELTHAVVGSGFTKPMPWLDEGLAQVFESGCPPVEDKERLAKLVRDVPGAERRLGNLLGLSRHGELDEDDYLLAWGFTWFLLQDRACGRQAVLKCLGPSIAGESAAERCIRCLGAPRGRIAGRFAAFLRSRQAAARRKSSPGE